MDQKKSVIGSMSLFTAALIWGTSFFVLKSNLTVIPAFFLVGIRFSIAMLIIGIIFRKRLRKINRAYWKAGSLIGIVLFIACAFQTYGLKYTTPGKNAFLLTSYCVQVPFIAWIGNKERPSINSCVSAIICMVGVGFVCLTEKLRISWGDGLTLISSIFYALQIYLVSKATRKLDPIVLTVIQFAVGAICNWAMSLLFRTIPKISVFTPIVIVGVLYLAIFGTSIGLVLQNIGQKYTQPSQAAILLSLESVFATVFSVLFYKEILTWRLLCGFALIFLAVLVSQIRVKES